MTQTVILLSFQGLTIPLHCARCILGASVFQNLDDAIKSACDLDGQASSCVHI